MGKYVKVTNSEIKRSIISKSVMIIIFVEFINQLIDYPINCASLTHNIHELYDPKYCRSVHLDQMPQNESDQDLYCLSLIQGPVVQRVVSLTNSLRVISLTVLADSIYNILIFFAEKM